VKPVVGIRAVISLGGVSVKQEQRRGAVLLLIVGWLAVSSLMGCVGVHDVPNNMKTWNEPFAPFHVAGNIYYVGTKQLAIFLFATSGGLILLDSGFESKVPLLRRNVETLGFRFGDIKILLASHAHIDHVQGHELIRRTTGARVLASAEDALVIATGGKGDWAYGAAYAWVPCPVDGIITDGEAVRLGETTLVAHLTPGHTKGATTWTTTAEDDGQQRRVVFFPSGNVPPGARLVDNPDFPDVVSAFERSFAIWRAMPCDIFLGSHGSFFDLEKKWRRRQTAPRPNPFIDPAGYQRAIDDAETRFRALLPSPSGG
jgi:metallo-beta-lactamase class B